MSLDIELLYSSSKTCKMLATDLTKFKIQCLVGLLAPYLRKLNKADTVVELRRLWVFCSQGMTQRHLRVGCLILAA